MSRRNVWKKLKEIATVAISIVLVVFFSLNLVQTISQAIYTLVFEKKWMTLYEVGSLALGAGIFFFSYFSYKITKRLYDPPLLVYQTSPYTIVIPNQGDIPIAILGIYAKVNNEKVPIEVKRIGFRETSRREVYTPIPFIIKAKDYAECRLFLGKLVDILRTKGSITILFEYKTIEEEPRQYEYELIKESVARRDNSHV